MLIILMIISIIILTPHSFNTLSYCSSFNHLIPGLRRLTTLIYVYIAIYSYKKWAILRENCITLCIYIHKYTKKHCFYV